MPYVGFEPMIPASERAKTIHALDRSASVTGYERIEQVKCEASPHGLMETLRSCRAVCRVTIKF
jgi:hypothetical protein